MPAISKVTISNMALSNIGSRSTIESLTEESVEARQCKIWYDASRIEALEGSDWTFARARQTLALHGDDAPEEEWAYRYQLPANCVSPRRLVNPLGPTAPAVPFEPAISDDGTKCLLTNLEEAKLIYTLDQENTALFSMNFVNALSYVLASKISFSLTGKRTIKADMINMARMFYRTADAQNANEGVAQDPPDSEWIEAIGG